MATSAALPNFQQYTAGSCTLEVEVQPSALSQWSKRAIAKDLSFQLWLHSAARERGNDAARASATAIDESRQLIAVGDRTDLQALAQYFQQQTQRVLAIASINTRTHSTVASPPPQSLQITKPLGYLQLCDVTTVITQYEQVTRTLPVALTPVLSAETDPSTVSAATSNVVPLAAARRQRAPRSNRREGARRRRPGVWASSAAAALFAVGLTTTLLSQDPSLQESSISSDSVPEAQPEDFAFESGKPQAAAPLPSQDSLGDVDTATRENNGDTDPAAPREFAAERNTQIGNASAPVTGAQRPQPTDATPPRAPVDRAPAVADSVDRAPAVADSGSDTAKPLEPQPFEGAGDSPNPESESAVVTQLPPSPTVRAPVASSQPPSTNAELSLPAQSQPSQDAALPEVEIATAESVSPDISVADTPATGDSDANSRQSSQPLAIERAASDPLSPPPIQQPRTIDETLEEDILTPSTERLVGALNGTTVPSSPARTISTISQVQTYFQQRWQNSETESLTYRLQLTAAGEVVSFVGLDNGSQAERDRLFPTDILSTFAPTPLPEGALVLLVQLKPDGTVEVTPF